MNKPTYVTDYSLNKLVNQESHTELESNRSKLVEHKSAPNSPLDQKATFYLPSNIGVLENQNQSQFTYEETEQQVMERKYLSTSNLTTNNGET